MKKYIVKSIICTGLIFLLGGYWSTGATTSESVVKEESSVFSIKYQSHVQNIGWQGLKKDGEMSGTQGESLRIEAFKIDNESIPQDLKITYQVHIQNIGWQTWKSAGEVAGTTGQSLRIEAIKIRISNTADYDIEYQAHVQNIGWQNWKKNGEVAGTTGQSLRIEAIRIKLTKKQGIGKIEIEIPATKQNVYKGKDINVCGWKAANVSNTKVIAYLDGNELNLPNISFSNREDLSNKIESYGYNADNNKPCFKFSIETSNLSLGSHSLKLDLVTSDGIMLSTSSKDINVLDYQETNVLYASNIEKYGWLQYCADGNISGIEENNLKIESIKVESSDLKKFSLKYQVHVSNYGWQDWKYNGENAGIIGQNKQIEAMKIILENSDDFSVVYRSYIRSIGWQDWKFDGEISGTTGMGKPIEAIQIKIVNNKKVGKLCIDTLNPGQRIYKSKKINICGWKMANVYNSRIRAYIDDEEIGQEDISYVSREDVIAIIKNYGTAEQNEYPGFKFIIDSARYVEGNHKLRIDLVSSNGKIICNSEINFYIVKDEDIHLIYNANMQKYGWLQYVADGEQSGRLDECLNLEGLKVDLLNAPTDAQIKYKAHVQNIGWQDWKNNDEIAGTEDKSLRIEAIRIQLENFDEFTVEYQVYIQDIGWSQWCIDGEIAGTVGQSKRIEAIKIRLVPKYKRRYMGIDVSVYNGKVDWNAVKKSGIDFAFIRVGYRGYGAAGNFAEDSRFKENIENAKKAGLKVGVYFVTQATNESEAIEEANWVIERIKSYKIDYPVALDVEYSSESNHNGRADHLDKNTRTILIKRFCDKIQNAGYTPIIYLNVDWAYNFVNMSQLSNYDTWIAHYKNNPNLAPSYTGSYTIWQYTSTGSVSGVSGSVDCNICYKKY